MKNFINSGDIINYQYLLNEINKHKNDKSDLSFIGKNKVIGLLFFNPSLRTRLSTQKAAMNLGFKSIVMNFRDDGWQLEFDENIIMSGNKAEHVKDAAKVISQYCDILGIRAFAELKHKEIDNSDKIINSFVKYATIPILNLESSIAHPLQALADAATINENINTNNPKIVLSWAPHPKPLPHAVANSFINMCKINNYDLTITNPKGYDLSKKITEGIQIINDQELAFKNADFIYAKNWSSYDQYGKVLLNDDSWIINENKMKLTNNAFFMHCLPIRRNVVVTDSVLDSNRSLVIQQANNRTYATQTILKELISNEK
ncbi:MAG: N-acetylornithine carbamoyltransferase [Flavobacteriaceae bacterium]|jgi:N-succinyl-L-ornithine transcarbamylase|nr:N-acetylornithine carbamoyltransferase [Flavobacteriaceae bacterium]MBT4231830.1 N-acetylornithine carbamoyltransferase [Flavobacteriaceae bacterium]